MTISSQAKDFIERAAAVWAEAPPKAKNLTLDNIAEYRNDHRDDYLPGSIAALDATGVIAEDVEIGGVRSLRFHVDQGGSGAILYFFGGAFVSGGPDEDAAITAPLCRRLRMPVYGPYYPLSPESPFPAALDAGVAAYRGLLEEFPSDKVAFVGQSAGGNLAVTVALKAIGDGSEPPACVVAMSPAADLGLTGYSSTLDGDPTMKPAEQWDVVMSAYVGEAGVDEPLVSPIHASFPPNYPPTLITTGTRDFLLSDCARLTHVMRKAGIDVSINAWDGMWHVFEHTFDLPEAADSLEDIAEFIRGHMGPE